MYSATAFNHAYGDAGVFCINASAPPDMLGELTQVLFCLKSYHNFIIYPSKGFLLSMWIQRLLKLFGFLANFPLEFLYDCCSDKFTSLLYLVVVTDCRFADNIDWIQQVDPVGYGSWRRVGPGQETADVDAADEPGKQTSYFRRRGTSSFGSGLAVKTCFYLPFFLIQCPLDIPTLDKAAALPIAAATRVIKITNCSQAVELLLINSIKTLLSLRF